MRWREWTSERSRGHVASSLRLTVSDEFLCHAPLDPGKHASEPSLDSITRNEYDLLTLEAHDNACARLNACCSPYPRWNQHLPLGANRDLIAVAHRFMMQKMALQMAVT